MRLASHANWHALCFCRLLQQYQDNTAPTKFVYLKRLPAHVAEYNPYILRVGPTACIPSQAFMQGSLVSRHVHCRCIAYTCFSDSVLQAVSYQKANKDELYTLSAEGVNQYRNSVHTEFTPLDQWQREVSLFTVLKKLKTFQSFKLWKAFRQAVYQLNSHLTGCLTVSCLCPACHASLLHDGYLAIDDIYFVTKQEEHMDCTVL